MPANEGIFIAKKVFYRQCFFNEKVKSTSKRFLKPMYS
ncbi:hypothetical protein PRO82_002201 [Candidatus Protochlamydia amoebophila]|nr:hypothetical protein [Candidatus Protochlamydia amoebophila]